MILSWIIDWTDLTVDLANEETKFAISIGSNRIMATIEIVESENILYRKVAMYIARIYPSSMELQQLLSIWLSRKDCDSYWPVAKVSRRLAPYSSGRNISRMAGWATPMARHWSIGLRNLWEPALHFPRSHPRISYDWRNSEPSALGRYSKVI